MYLKFYLYLSRLRLVGETTSILAALRAACVDLGLDPDTGKVVV